MGHEAATNNTDARTEGRMAEHSISERLDGYGRIITMSLKVTAERDAFGQEIWSCYKGATAHEINEREDGLIDIGNAQNYFKEFADWPVHEREAIARAHGQ